MGSKLSRHPMPGAQGKEAGGGRLGLPLGAGLSHPTPFLFPGGEDDIFRDPFGDFVPSGR